MKQIVLTIILIVLPIWVIGQDNNESKCYLWHNAQYIQEYCKEVPGRMFIQKESDVSKEFVVSLLDELTDSQFELSWCPKEGYQDNYCRVLVDDALIDSIIGELAQSDSILMARRIYVKKDYYDKYVISLRQSGVRCEDFFKEPNMKNSEMWFLNELICTPVDLTKAYMVPKDSICNALGLTYEMIGSVLIKYKTSEKTDIFGVAYNLFKTNYFSRVSTEFVAPYNGMSFDEMSEGCWKNISDHFFLYNSDGNKKIYYELPNRLFVQKSDDVTQEYINSLLNRVIATEYEKEWSRDYICRITADEAFTDSIINEIAKDDGVLSARRIYVTKDNYERYKYYPNMERGEEWFYNGIICSFEGKLNHNIIDSLSNALGLTIQEINESKITFETAKNADIFYVSQKLFESGCFTDVSPKYGFSPKVNSWSDETLVFPTSEQEIKMEKVRYGLDGRMIDASIPGMHIIKYSDGSLKKIIVTSKE